MRLSPENNLSEVSPGQQFEVMRSAAIAERSSASLLDPARYPWLGHQMSEDRRASWTDDQEF
jgi:hypothetical protein